MALLFTSPSFSLAKFGGPRSSFLLRLLKWQRSPQRYLSGKREGGENRKIGLSPLAKDSMQGTSKSPTPNLDLHPVVVGQGRYTFHRKGRAQGRHGLTSPLQLMSRAVKLAAEDAGLRSLVGGGFSAPSAVSRKLTTQLFPLSQGLQSWNVVGMIGDARYGHLRGSKTGWRVYDNPPACVAAEVGEDPGAVRDLVYTADGGNMPQALVNSVCDQSECCARLYVPSPGSSHHLGTPPPLQSPRARSTRASSSGARHFTASPKRRASSRSPCARARMASAGARPRSATRSGCAGSRLRVQEASRGRLGLLWVLSSTLSRCELTGSLYPAQ